MRKSLIFTLLFLLLPSFAYAGEGSVSYRTLISVINIMSEYTHTIYPLLIAGFKGLFITVVSFLLFFQILKYMRGEGDIYAISQIAVSLVFVSAIVFSTENYLKWVYEPLTSLVYDLPDFVFTISSGGEVNDSARFEGVFANVDAMRSDMLEVSSKLNDNLGIFDSVILGLTALFLWILYGILRLAFLVSFVLSIVAFHIMLTVLPIGIALSPFNQTRGVLFNILRSAATYGIKPFFIAIAISISMFMLKDVVVLANTWSAVDGHIDMDSAPFQQFYSDAIIGGVIGLFMIFMASEFASAVTGGQISRMSAMGGMMGMASAGFMAGRVGGALGRTKAGQAVGNLKNKALGATGRGIKSGAGKLGNAAMKPFMAKGV